MAGRKSKQLIDISWQKGDVDNAFSSSQPRAKHSKAGSLKIVLLSLTIISCLIIGSMLIYASVQHQKALVAEKEIALEGKAAAELAAARKLSPSSVPSAPTPQGGSSSLPQPPALTIPGSSEPSDDTEWPMFHRYLNRTGYIGVDGPTTANRSWVFNVPLPEGGGSAWSSPIVVGGVVYFTSWNSTFALDETDGSLIWNFTRGDVTGSFPAFADGIVYIGYGTGGNNSDNNMYALNATDGSVVWNYTTGGRIYMNHAAIADGVIYFGASDNKTYALNASNGNLIWNHTFEQYENMYSSPAIANGILYLGAETTGICEGCAGDTSTLYALNITDNGSEIWNFTVTPADWQGVAIEGTPAVADGFVYFDAWNNGTLFALNATTGSVIWSYNAGGLASSPAVANGLVYFGSYDFPVFALNATTGSHVWNYSTGNIILSSPSVANDIVYISSRDHYIYAINATNGSLIWNYNTGYDDDSSPAIVNGVMYVGGAYKLYAFGPPKPFIDSAELYPAAPVLTTDDLTLNATCLDDNPSDNLTLYWSVYKNGIKQSSLEGFNDTTNGTVFSKMIVDDGDTSENEKWKAQVWCGNGTLNSSKVNTSERTIIYNINLLPTDIAYSTLLSGESITINATINNTGTDTAGAFNVSLYVDNVYQAQNRINSLAGSAGIITSFTWTATSGMHELKIVADSAGEVTETNEADNNLSESIAIDWPMFRQDWGHHGLANGAGPKTNNTAWVYNVGDLIDTSPAVVNGIVYFGSNDNKVHAINATSGSQIWDFTGTDDFETSSPAVVNDILYIGSYDGYLYALNATNGSQIWYSGGTVGQLGGMLAAPIVVNGLVYQATMDGCVYSFNVTTGTWIGGTCADVGFESIYSSPAYGNELFYFGSYDNYVYAWDGLRLVVNTWNYATGDDVYSSPTVDNGIVYIGSKDKSVYALNTTNGNKIWNHALGDIIWSSTALANGVLYVGDYDNKVYALYANNGSEKWTYTTGGVISSSPAVAGDIVYVGSYDNNVYALNTTNGNKIWNYATGDDVLSSPAVVDGVMYVGSRDGKLYAFDDLLTISGVSPASGTTITTATPTINFTTDKEAWCRASTTDESYDAMADNINCSGSGTTSQSCAMNLGADGAKNVYLACRDKYGVNHSASTNTDLSYTLDTTAPVVTLSAPANGTSVTAPVNVTFNYSVNDATSNITNCSLYGTFGGSWGLNQTNSSAITESATENFTINNLGRGVYTWNVKCYDTTGWSAFASANRTYTVGYIVQNVSVNAVLADNESVYVNETPQALSKSVLLKTTADKMIGAITVDFNQATGAIDLADMVADTNISAKTAILYDPSWPTAVESSKTLYIPSTGVRSVYICEDATNLADVNESCPGYFTVTVGQTYLGITVSTTTIGGQDYYKAEGVTGTGGGETENPVVPEFNFAGILIALFGGLCIVLIRLSDVRIRQPGKN